MRVKRFSVDKAAEALEGIHDKYRDQKGAIIPILQDVQEEFGYIPEDAVNWIADRLDVPRSFFFGVATFYAQFHLKPRGKNVITVCSGTACHVKGSEKLYSGARRELDLPEGEDTTPDMTFTVEKLACLGTCSMAPAIIISNKIHGKMTVDRLNKQIRTMIKKKE